MHAIVSNFQFGARAPVRARSLLFLLKPTRYTFCVCVSYCCCCSRCTPLIGFVSVFFARSLENRYSSWTSFSFHFISFQLSFFLFLIFAIVTNQNEDWDKKNKSRKKSFTFIFRSVLFQMPLILLLFVCFTSCSFICRGFLSYYATIFCFENFSPARSCHCSIPNTQIATIDSSNWLSLPK